jgi:hypothetical protein
LAIGSFSTALLHGQTQTTDRFDIGGRADPVGGEDRSQTLRAPTDEAAL